MKRFFLVTERIAYQRVVEAESGEVLDELITLGMFDPREDALCTRTLTLKRLPRWRRFLRLLPDPLP